MICTLTTSLKLSWKAQLPVARASSTSYSATCSPWFMFSLNFIFCDVCSASVFWFFLQDILGLWSPSSFSSTHCWNADNSPRAWLSSFSPFHLNDILSHCCILASVMWAWFSDLCSELLTFISSSCWPCISDLHTRASTEKSPPKHLTSFTWPCHFCKWHTSLWPALQT